MTPKALVLVLAALSCTAALCAAEIATCKNIDADLPPECPETIGPPCPR